MDAPSLTLVKDALLRTGACHMEVRGRSMLPFILPGDLIELHTLSDLPRPGEVIAVQSNEQVIVHRVIRLRHAQSSSPQVIIAGDSSAYSTAIIHPHEILGMVHTLKRKQRNRRFWLHFPGSLIALVTGFGLRWYIRTFRSDHTARPAQRPAGS